MKKLLIIQLDEAYFLFETCLMLERHRDALKDFKLTFLVDPISLKSIQDGSGPIIEGVTTDPADILDEVFDLSVNFSLNEASWPLHGKIVSHKKLGTFELESKLSVPDVWSSYLLTLKGRAPFLTFHLQDIYKNILGIKRMSQEKVDKKMYNEIIIGLCNTHFFSADEQERLVNLTSLQHPQLTIKDISEVDYILDHSNMLYIGPATLEALKLCEDGARGIFLTSQFQGFNLLPHNSGHYLISSNQAFLKADTVIEFINAEILNAAIPSNFPYSLYKIDEEHLFGSYLKNLNQCDNSYPIYQAHVVLWNFILNLFEVNLEIVKCNLSQVELLNSQKDVLIKLIRLYDYAMSSINTIHQESKSGQANDQNIQGHLSNLQDIEKLTDQISQNNSYLRPVIDFYRIRRGQNNGDTFAELSQHSFLTYSEEHQAFKAMLELITVTLQQNEVSI